jgi:NADH:ubiquinone oxidoreductase subunit 3 (subunit A)
MPSSLPSIWNILLTPLLGFALFVGVAFLIYKLGDVLAPKLKAEGAKLEAYACGEKVPGQKWHVGYRLFFYAALFFTMMHVAALVIATIPGGSLAYALLGIVYLLMITLSIMALILK